MKVVLKILFFWFFLACQPATTQSFAQGKVFHHLVNQALEIEVYVPATYDSTRLYKCLYFNDGETIFQYGYGWDLHRKLDELIEKKIIEPILVVAIYANGKRNAWYNPYEDEWIRENWGEYVPQAKEYTEVIVNELVPFIEKKYKVYKDKAFRAIAGYSLGGLHATWVGLKYPDFFGFAVALSPSFWVKDYAIFQELRSESVSTLNPKNRFWFDIGTAEWNYYVPFYQNLQKAGYQAGRDCFYYEVKDAKHIAQDWLARIDYPLKIFAGIKQDFTPQKLEIQVYCMPSESNPSKIYRRINAIAILANEIKYTLSNTATYTLLEGDISLAEDGTIIKIGKLKTAKVQVKFQNFSKTISFKVENCR